MVIYITLLDLLTILELAILQVLESYCIEKCFENYHRYQALNYCPSEELGSFYNVEEVIPSLDCIIPEEKNELEKANFEKSSIEGTAAEALFNSLQIELNDSSDQVENTAEYFQSLENAEPIIMESDENNDFQRDNFLSISDLEIDEESPYISNEYTELATAKISDDTLGLQQWTVNVIGSERQFVHVSDGTRIWIDLGKYTKNIHNGDILSLDVNRTIEKIEVINVKLLHSISEDYLIHDEFNYEPELEKGII